MNTSNKLSGWLGARLPHRQKRQSLKRQAKHFAWIGIVATAIDVALLNVLVVFAGAGAVAANLASVSGSTGFSYFFNRRFTFSHGETDKRSTIVPYIAVTAVGIYGIQSLVIWLVMRYLGDAGEIAADVSRMLVGGSLPADIIMLNIAKLLAVGVAAIWNFAMYRRTVFKAHRHEP